MQSKGLKKITLYDYGWNNQMKHADGNICTCSTLANFVPLPPLSASADRPCCCISTNLSFVAVQQCWF